MSSSSSERKQKQIRLMISGSSSGVGKSTISLAILGSLIKSNMYKSDELAYIKPCTQGIQQTLTAKFCKSNNIICRHVGPVVFYRGFTTKFTIANSKRRNKGKLDSDENNNNNNNKDDEKSDDDIDTYADIPTTEEMCMAVKNAVDDIGRNKKVIIIDGVGYPSVGSIVGVCNAKVAHITGSNVLLVGKEGLGDCVDTYNICETYFKSFNVNVIGMIINRVKDNKYIINKTSYVTKYFDNNNNNKQKVYGMLLENNKFAIDGENYAPPGQYNQCFITFGKPKADMLTVDPCNEKEMNLCNDLFTIFLEKIGIDILKEIINDCSSVVAATATAAATAVASNEK